MNTFSETIWINFFLQTVTSTCNQDRQFTSYNIWPKFHAKHVEWLFGGLPFMLKYPLSDLALHVGYQSRVSTSFDWLSSCHRVILSHPVIISPYQHVNMSPFHHIIMSIHRVIKSSYRIWHCMRDINHWWAKVLTDRHQMSPYCYHSAIVIILSSENLLQMRT